MRQEKNRPPTMLNKVFLVLSYMILMIMPWESHVNYIFLTVWCFKLISCTVYDNDPAVYTYELMTDYREGHLEIIVWKVTFLNCIHTLIQL